MTSLLFSPLTLRGVVLPNRIVVSPMCQYEAQEGCATDWHLMHLGQFAVGGAGLVMVEATGVSPEGRISHRCLGLYNDACEQALRRVVAFCKRYGQGRLGIQLAHAGRKGSSLPPAEGGGPLRREQGSWVTQAPSALPYAAGWPTPQALTLDDMQRVKRAFVTATQRAARIGFDVAEIHAGHGYLLHQFLSPLSNQRDDSYGGDTAGRMRFPLEVFGACRAVWPADRPMGVRVSATDWVEGGWTPQETVAFAAALRGMGADFVDVTSGGLDPRQKIPLGPGYQAPFAAQVRRETGIATMAVGMITQPRQAERLLAEGAADMVALARSMMLDPRWPWHAAQALGAEGPLARNYARAHPSNWPQAFQGDQAAE